MNSSTDRAAIEEAEVYERLLTVNQSRMQKKKIKNITYLSKRKDT